MEAGGRQSNDDVAFCGALIVDNLCLVNNAYSEACKVIVVSGHGAGVLSGFAADKSAACADAALSHTGNNGGYLLGDILADCNIVKEEQGLCAAADNIVNAHCNTVDADSVVLIQKLGKAELGAYAIGAGNQNGFLHTGYIGSKQAAEATNIGNNTGDMGALNCLAHELYAFVSGGNINAGCGVCCGMGVFHLKTSVIIYSLPVQQ